MGLWGALVLLALLGGGGCPFELQEAIRELQSENAQLQGRVQNLSQALGELRLLVWNRSRDSGAAPEHLLHDHLPCRPDLPHGRGVGPHLHAPCLGLLAAGLTLGALALHGPLPLLAGD
ncbi:unnamed protein product [Eretmochelys imbricata]